MRNLSYFLSVLVGLGFLTTGSLFALETPAGYSKLEGLGGGFSVFAKKDRVRIVTPDEKVTYEFYMGPGKEKDEVFYSRTEKGKTVEKALHAYRDLEITDGSGAVLAKSNDYLTPVKELTASAFFGEGFGGFRFIRVDGDKFIQPWLRFVFHEKDKNLQLYADLFSNEDGGGLGDNWKLHKAWLVK